MQTAMSKHFDDLMAGLNEAIAIERGELKGKRTVYEIQPVKKRQRANKAHKEFSWNDADVVRKLHGRFLQDCGSVGKWREPSYGKRLPINQHVGKQGF